MFKIKVYLRTLYLFCYLLLEIIFNLNATVNSGNFKDSKKDYTFHNSIHKNKFLTNRNHLLENFFKKKLSDTDNKFLNLLLANNEIKKKDIPVEIFSDTQYQLGDKYYAEGNVVIILNNGELKTDKLIYDKIEESLILDGNVTYFKGNQYLKASFLTFSFREDKGYLKDIYGVLDLVTFSDDLGFKFEEKIEIENKDYQANRIRDLRYEDSVNIGLENTFESGKDINITDLKFDVPQIKKWRFKANKIKIENNDLFSDKVFFTNDPFNEPQFILESKKFSVETVKDKIRLLSKNTWINLDNKVSFPIGRRRIIDRDPISRWGIGSDYEDKDGFYISRSFNSRKIFDKYDLKITPYLLFQRAIKGKTNSFVEKNSSILSNKINQDISFADYFAINTSLKGNIYSWNLNVDADINSLDLGKFPYASRGLITLNKSFDLRSKKIIDDEAYNSGINEINMQLYGAYRQKVERSFTGDEEIYLGKGFTVSKIKGWENKLSKNIFTLNYDLGEFESKEKSQNKLKTSMRNVFTATFENQIPIWQKQNLDNQIDVTYKYSPEVIKQGLTWVSSIKSGIYFYGDGSQQNAITFSSGPRIILGSLKRKFFDYTDLNVQADFILKNGESPFAFDDIDKTQKLKFYLEQQLVGPLLFSYEGFFNLDNSSVDYAKFSNNTYALNIKRRAYSVGAFYKESSKAFGVQFNINNFNYLGSSSKF